MADDKSNRSGRDRSRVSAEEAYRLRYFAQRHGLTVEQAQQLIARRGNNREELDRAAEQMKG